VAIRRDAILLAMLTDTIAAIATPVGEGGLAVLRLSGRSALAIADRCFVPRGRSSTLPSAAPTHTVHYGHIVAGPGGRRIDEVLVTVLRTPRTFTREDTVEISCHGGLLPAQQVLAAILAAGARLAHPGEFTQRAFLNGRLDLTQAEAVADVIGARTDLALAAAQEQLAGKLSARIRRLRDDLMTALAHVEAHIDFPDEDIAPDSRDTLVARLEQSLGFTDNLLRTAREGRILRQGVRAGILGRPNVGKSSLLNQLLGHDRAIVSPLPGTTRDTIEETASVCGLPIRFIDTAGLRDPSDDLEQEGIRRSRHIARDAEFILHVLDASVPFTDADAHLLGEFADKPRILVLNKSDLPTQLHLPPGVVGNPIALSCRTGDGLESLRQAITDLVWSGEICAERLDVAINVRHQDALRRAHEALDRTLDALRRSLTLELVALELRMAVNAVGEIVGETATADLLDRIFSHFCIGK
jgi:tRNA modification GTPase